MCEYDVNLITTLKWLPFKNPRHCRFRNECYMWIEIRNFIELSNAACRQYQNENLIHIRIAFSFFLTFHFDNGQWNCWNRWPSSAILYQKYDAHSISTNSFEYDILSFKVSVCMCDLIVKVIMTVEIENKRWKKSWIILSNIETKDTNEMNSFLESRENQQTWQKERKRKYSHVKSWAL